MFTGRLCFLPFWFKIGIQEGASLCFSSGIVTTEYLTEDDLTDSGWGWRPVSCRLDGGRRNMGKLGPSAAAATARWRMAPLLRHHFLLTLPRNSPFAAPAAENGSCCCKEEEDGGRVRFSTVAVDFSLQVQRCKVASSQTQLLSNKPIPTIWTMDFNDMRLKLINFWGQPNLSGTRWAGKLEKHKNSLNLSLLEILSWNMWRL